MGTWWVQIWIYITGVKRTEVTYGLNHTQELGEAGAIVVLYGLNRTENSAVRLALRKGAQGRTSQEVTPGPLDRPT